MLDKCLSKVTLANNGKSPQKVHGPKNTTPFFKGSISTILPFFNDGNNPEK
jgi:hypothetical protein